MSGSGRELPHLSESSSNTSMESVDPRTKDLDKSQTFGQMALTRHLAQNKKDKFE